MCTLLLMCVMRKTILTLNSLSRIILRLGQVEELVCSRMKYSRLYVILLHLVLSAKSVYIFWPGLMALAPHAAPFTTPPPHHHLLVSISSSRWNWMEKLKLAISCFWESSLWPFCASWNDYAVCHDITYIILHGTTYNIRALLVIFAYFFAIFYYNACWPIWPDNFRIKMQHEPQMNLVFAASIVHADCTILVIK